MTGGRHIDAGACRLLLLLLLAFAVPAGPAHAQSCDLEPTLEGVVARVVDAETVVLENGETVRLTGALAPMAPPWWKGEAPWRAAERARAALEALVMGKTVRLGTQGRERDRRKRLLAQMFLAEGEAVIWVQGAMVAQGQARAYSLPGSTACVRALQRVEADARKRRAGIWRDPHYRVWAAPETEEMGKRRYSYEIVEGRIASVAALRKWTFLNFGADYHSDFTVAIAARDRRGFAPQIDLQALEGKRVRVRGWLERWNGPVIKATHPEQIELIETAVTPDAAVAGSREGEAKKKPGASGAGP